MKIVLIGYMGVGKTTIGKQLAKILGYTFVDLDAYIEEKEEMSVSDIFKSKGEIYFRKQENHYLKEILISSQKLILSLGGGTPCYAGNMNLINEAETISYYLQLSPNYLSKRLYLEKNKRPLIKDIQTKEKLTEFIAIHLFERQNFYSQATYTLNITDLSITQIAEDIVKKLY